MKIGTLDVVESIYLADVIPADPTNKIYNDGGQLYWNGLAVGAGSGGSYILPKASASTLGGIRVGANLSIDVAGILSAPDPYTLPVATDALLGGIRVGSGLSVDGSGVLSATPYVLPAATAGALGGVRVGARLSIDGSGVLSADEQTYTLPMAAAGTLGGIRVGARLSIDGSGVLSAADQTYTLPTASASILGGVRVGSGLAITSGILSATYTLPTASATVLGGIKVGANLSIDGNGVLSGTSAYVLPVAAAGTLGGVRIGAGLSVDGSGVASVDFSDSALLAGAQTFTGQKTFEQGLAFTDGAPTSTAQALYSVSGALYWNGAAVNTGGGYTLPAASGTVLGGIKVGARLSIDGSGVLSAADQAYVLPAASAGALGGIRVGARLSIDGSGILSADAQTYTLPTATDEVLGGVMVGAGLSITGGVLSTTYSYSLPIASDTVLGGVKIGTGLQMTSDVASVVYGTAAGTAAAGNDSRLSDSRAPTAHALDGALHTISGKTAGQLLLATAATTFAFTTLSGDATLSGAGALTLASTAVSAGSYGSNSSVSTFTVDDKGRLTAAGSTAIAFPVASVFGRAGAVVATSGDYNTSQVTESTNLYFTTARAQAAISGTGAISVPAGVVTHSTADGYLHVPATSTTNSGRVLMAGATAGSLSWTQLTTAHVSGLTSWATKAYTDGSTTDVAEGTNLYFTNARAIAAATPAAIGAEPALGNPGTNGYVLSSTTAGVRSWVSLPSVPVASVFGRTGAVVATSGDYTTAHVTESGNLYFTEARALSSVLTGYAVGTNTALAATDSVLAAFGKVQAQINARPGTVTSVAMTAAGPLSVSGSPITSSGTLALTWSGTSTDLVRGDGSVVASSSFAAASHVHAIANITNLQTTLDGKEAGLGNPGTNGYLLSSTTAGVRSWVAPYTLPLAAAGTLGGVRVGTGLSIDGSGILSVTAGAPSNMVTTDTTQTVSGAKTLSSVVLTTTADAAGSDIYLSGNSMLAAMRKSRTTGDYSYIGIDLDTHASAGAVLDVYDKTGTTYRGLGLNWQTVSQDAWFDFSTNTAGSQPSRKINAYVNLDFKGGLWITDAAPYSTANALYSLGGVLYWNGAAVATGGGGYTLPPATATTLGGIKVGDGLAIDGSDVLSVTYAYTLPTAAAAVLGGIKVGARLSIDGAGVLSAADQTYTLPIAAAGSLGGIRVGAGLSIDGSGILSTSVTAEPALGNPGTNGYVLASTTAGVRSWVALPVGAVTTVFGRAGAVVATSGDYNTDQVTEGTTNLYYTNSRADARITLQKGAALGLATLGADGKIPLAQLPATAIVDTFTAASEVAMLALSAEQGDVCVRTDIATTFILSAAPASTLANWQQLLSPVDGVTSVGLSAPSIFTVSGSPVTSSGTLSFAWNSTSAYVVLGDGSTSAVTTFTKSVLAGADAPAVRTTLGLTGWATKTYTDGSTTDIAEGTNLYWTSGRFDTAFSAKTTDGLTEGSTNLYFTNTRAQAAISATAPLSYAGGVVSHLLTDGNMHVPATSTTNNGRALVAGATAGSFSWTQLGISHITGLQTALDGKLASVTGDTTSRTANTFYAAPNGSAGTALFRAIVAADLPVSGVTANSYGSAANTLTATVDTYGRLTALAATSIAISTTQVTSGTLGVARGGTGLASWTQYALVYASGTTTLAGLAPNTLAAKRFLTMTGDGDNGAAPAWSQVAAADVSGLTGWATKAYTDGSTTDVAEGTNLYWTSGRFDTAFAAKNTDGLTEGSTNLYYTDARARASVSATGPISYVSGTGVIAHATSGVTANTYGSTTAVAVVTVNATGHVTSVSTSNIAFPVTSVFGRTGAVVATAGDYNTDLVTEGTTNLYYTNSRADARITLQKGAALGLATLDAGGKIPLSQLPATAIVETFTAASEVAMLALSAQQGDVCVRTDISTTFILTATPASTIGNWQQLLSPLDGVTSVGLSAPGIFTVSGSPITASGMLSFAWNSTSAFVVLGDGTTSAVTAHGKALFAGADASASRTTLGLTGWATKAYTNGSTTDVAEGTNLYWTSGRFDTALGTKTTDNLGEGTTNLYFTAARAQAAISATGPIAYATGVVSHATSGVTANSYGDAASTLTATVNATGHVTSLAASAIAIAASQVTSGTLGVARGGTGLATFTGAYYLPYSTAATTLAALAPNTSTSIQALTMTGTGAAGAVPTWVSVLTAATGDGIVVPTTTATTGAVAFAHAAFGTANTYGSATQVPVITTNATGHVTGVSLSAITAAGIGAEAALGNPGTSGYVLASTTGGVRSWVALPTGAVTTVFGRAGAVVATAGDYTTAQVTESGSLYFTEARVLATVLTGYASGTNTALAATDTVLAAFGKIQAQINARPGTVTSVAMSATGPLSVAGSPVTSTGTLALTWSGTSADMVRADGSTVAQSTFQTALTNPVTGTGANTRIAYWSGTGTQTSAAGLTFDGTSLLAPSFKATDLAGGGAGLYLPIARDNVGTLTSRTAVQFRTDIGAEAALGNPGVDGYVLSSTAAGVRSWVLMTGGGGVTTVFGRSGAVVATSGDYTTAQVTESGSLYFTEARVCAAVLTGLSTSTNAAVIATDSVLVAFGKLQAHIAAIDYTTQKAVFVASTTSYASANMPSGVAPSSPVSGDLWNASGLIKFYDGAAIRTLAALEGPQAFTSFTTSGCEVVNTTNENYRVLLHFDGSNGSRRFLDAGSYGTQVAAVGSNYYTFATHSTTQTKFGGSSLYLNGSTWLEVFSRYSIGTGDFSVDFHVYLTSTSGTQTMFDWGGTASGVVLSYSGGVWTLTVAGTACTFSQTPSANTWYHIAMSRTSNSVRFFVAGTKTGTTQTASGSVTATNTASLLIGANAALANRTSAYIDEFRFLTGVSAYTSDSNITVPTAAYAPHGFRFAKSTNTVLPTGYVLALDSNGLATPQRPPVVRTVTFVLGESITNSSKYFYVSRGLGNTQDDAQRSGNASGMSYANACSPEIAPCNGRVVRAILKLQGAGTNTGTVTYPVTYRCDLYRVGWAAEHDPNINGGSPVTVNFSLTSGVGTYSLGTTNATVVAYNLDIPVNVGDALALKFIAAAGNSTVALSQMAVVTLVIEETF